MINDTRTILQKKVDAFFLLGTQVHISFLNSEHWKNGTIKEVKEDYFVLIERVLGEVLVFFQEVKDIREYEEKRE